MELKLILEALLFSAQKPLTPIELRDFIALASSAPVEGKGEGESARAPRKHKIEEIQTSLEELAGEHEVAGRSFKLICVAGSWQFASRAEFAPWLRAMVGQKPRPPRLTQAALETLAIVAYRQPLTRAEIEQVRGVSVDGVMQTLLERELIEQTGRAEVAGRPMTYGTTSKFLEYFGLRAIEDLPAADELRRVPLQKPAHLATTEPGLATAPPPDLTVSTPDTKEPNPEAERPDLESRSSGAGSDAVPPRAPEEGGDSKNMPSIGSEAAT
jgi:segregation and condensation protein B